MRNGRGNMSRWLGLTPLENSKGEGLQNCDGGVLQFFRDASSVDSFEMKYLILLFLSVFIAGCESTSSYYWQQASVSPSMVNSIYEQADWNVVAEGPDISTNQIREAQHKEQISEAMEECSLVVRGVVLDGASSVRACKEQTEVSYGQGWSAIIIRSLEQIKGVAPERILFVDNRVSVPADYGNASGLETERKTGSFRVDGEYVLFLKRNEKLSNWCCMDIFEKVLSVPLKDSVPVADPGGTLRSRRIAADQ